MANIKSQKKRIITNEKRRMRNRAVKSELKTATRHVKDAVAAGDGKAAYAFACEACRLMDKAASKGVIHKNQAANRKSGIMALANSVATAEDKAAAYDAACDYYLGTVFDVQGLTEIGLRAGEITFQVSCTKGGAKVDPDRTISLARENGAWTVVSEGY